MVHKWHTEIYPLGKFKRKMTIPSMLAAAGNAGCVHSGLGKGGYTPVASKAKKFKETKRPLTNNAFRYVLQRSKVDKRGSICIIGKLAGQF